MYSVGYAGYYAMSLLTFSPAVLFVSLAAHAMQFGFLRYFEEGHIERVYGGGRKPLAARVPLVLQKEEEGEEGETPALTSDGDDGETEVEVETETETEEDDQSEEQRQDSNEKKKQTRTTRTRQRTFSTSSYDSMLQSHSRSSTSINSNGYNNKNNNNKDKVTLTTRHDLDNTWFRKDLLIFKNFDPFRLSPLSSFSPFFCPH